MSRRGQLLALVAGIGNPDRGDDGFGPAVARQLRRRVANAGVRIIERVGDALGLIEDWSDYPFVIIIDAVAPIAEPGRVHRLDLTRNPLPIGLVRCSSHAFGVAETVELARSLGRLPHHLVAYLVEGEQFATGAQLSTVIVEAVEIVAERIVAEVLPMLRAKGAGRHA